MIAAARRAPFVDLVVAVEGVADLPAGDVAGEDPDGWIGACRALIPWRRLLPGLARALLWSHVVAWVDEAGEWQPVTEAGFDHDRFAIYVWRSVRASGDTKTQKSRRTLELPAQAAEALRAHRLHQLAERLEAGPLWCDRDLVFTSQAGTPLDASHVRRSYRIITKKAGLGVAWTPRELRHSFVSIMSDNGVPIETIADLVGHASTSVTEKVYRHQLKPVITTGAETMNTIFSQHKQIKSA